MQDREVIEILIIQREVEKGIIEQEKRVLEEKDHEADQNLKAEGLEEGIADHQ